MALLVGVALALGLKAVLTFGFLVVAYGIASLLITPYLRLALRQKMRYSRRIRLVFSESLRSIRDIHLYSSQNYFVSRFTKMVPSPSATIDWLSCCQRSTFSHRTSRNHSAVCCGIGSCCSEW